MQNPDGTTNVTVRIYAANPTRPIRLSGCRRTRISPPVIPRNYGAATNMGIGYNSSGPQAMRMLMQFNLSGIPSNATVNSATVYLYQRLRSPANVMGFQAQYAVSPWSEYNATWNNANYLGGAPLPMGNFPNTVGWLAVNAVNLFRNWISGAQPNYGLIITGNENPAANNCRYFYSSNAGRNRPYVDINYTTGCSYTTAPTSYGQWATGHFAQRLYGQLDRPSIYAVRLRGNGISSYIVWYQVNGGEFIKWLDGCHTLPPRLTPPAWELATARWWASARRPLTITATRPRRAMPPRRPPSSPSIPESA